MFTLRRIAAAIAVPVAAGAAVALLPTTAQASAAAKGTITLCSRGSYASHFVFPGRGGWVTDLAPSGQCRSYSISVTSGVEQVNVNGAGGIYIASFQWDTSRTLTVNTIDTASGKSFYIS